MLAFMRKVILKNIGDLSKLVENQARDFVSGQSRCIGLVGPLGVGKTAFANELLKVLGTKNLVTSPTFTIMHEYDTTQGRVLHADLYRVDKKDHETVALLQEQITQADFAVLEWIDRVPSLKKIMDRIYIMSFGQSESSRNISVEEKR
jgi:tRNA threonylcarbamoyladenosine biosynthesis protein TsaE